MQPYLLFAICVLLTTLPLYQTASQRLEAQELELSHAWLERGAATLDQQLYTLQQTVIGLSANNDYRKYATTSQRLLTTDYVQLRKMNDLFRQMVNPIDLVLDCGIRYPNGLTFTRYRVFIDDNPYGTYISYADMDEAAWIETMQSASQNTLLPVHAVNTRDYGSYSALTWVTPLATFPTTRQVAFFYAMLDVRQISSLMMADDLLDDSYLILRHADGTILMTYGAMANTEGYHSLTANVPLNSLVVEMGISPARFASRMQPIRQVLMLYIILAVSIALIMALFFAYRSSKPMQRLLQLAETTPHTSPEGARSRSDYDTVANALVGLHQSAEGYRQALENQALHLRTRVFDRFLQGDWARQTKEFERLFPNFPNSFHLAMIRPEVVLPGEADLLERRAEKQLLLQKLCGDYFEASVYTQLLERSIILVLPYEQAEDTARYTQLLTAVRVAFERAGGGRCCIVLSEAFSGYTMLGNAYAQTQSILQQTDADNRFIDVWRLSNFPNRPPVIPLRYEDMILLHKMLTMGNAQAVHDVLRRIQTDIQQSGYLDSVILHQIFYGLRGVLLRVKLENLALLAELYVPDYHVHSDLEQIMDEFATCCAQICAALESQRHQGGRRDFASQVLEFIDENVQNSALYAKMVASHFDISETTLQKIVREATGHSFFDYVEQRRFALAHELLTGTDLPVNEIAARCGYASPNSFYKAFKRHARMTPSALREAQRAKDHGDNV